MAGPARCILCDRAGPHEPLFSDGPLVLVRCSGCGLVFQDPQPGEVALAQGYYEDEAFAERLFGEFREITLKNARHKREMLRRAGVIESGMRVLDVGASSGAWLEIAAEEGVEATGVELGAVTASKARERGLDVREGTLAERLPELEAERFDLISFWDVLEHLPDPREELRLAAGLLAPGGRVAATFPNVEGLYPRLTYRLIARRTGVWEYPERNHLYDFSPDTARLLLERAGLALDRLETYATPFGYYRTTSLTPERTGPGLRGRLLRGAFAGLRLVAYPLAGLTGRGNAMLVVSAPVPGR